MHNPEVVYNMPRIVNEVNIIMYIDIHYCIYCLHCLIKFNHMNFCPRLDCPMPAGVCVVATEGVFY